ncbi:flagellar biosynthetic protein FliR [Gammaproteobacteria bacterium]|nr:flagellar biosynthetic protein FliR [Gammaproteobacteria bacterium]
MDDLLKMELSLDDIFVWMGDFFWPFLRIGALFLASPIFGARTVPVKIRIILAIVITLVIHPLLPASPVVEPLSADGMLIIFQQLSIGIVMGMVLQIMFAALVMAGQTMATTMGLGFASAVDPQNGIQVTMVGQFYLIIATLFFLALDGHLLLIQIFANSFIVFPVSTEFISVDIFWSVCLFSTQMFLAAMLIALPTIVGVLLVNLGFGVMTRAAPQLNIFSMGFPITMMAGFILMLLSLPVLSPLLVNLFTNSFDFMRVIIN